MCERGKIDPEPGDRFCEASTDPLVCEAPKTVRFVLDADRWSRLIELLERPPDEKQLGLEKLFSKRSVFSAT